MTAVRLSCVTDKEGRESLVVVAKGSYGIPARPSEPPRLIDSSFHSATGEFQPLNAAAVLERYAEDHPDPGFAPGARYFFGKRAEWASMH
ncbi:hypothetical protein [Methylibium rhizosphaerae]|uniref:hypothetical protein n=1 Tax=Methylibium rhizosphaerae TaxID=2570323 RepID=UPI00112AF672|nr:hypothetical protein [Methylibium rhizosphaerae]